MLVQLVINTGKNNLSFFFFATNLNRKEKPNVLLSLTPISYDEVACLFNIK